MLRYLGLGKRAYGENTIRVCRRNLWEFQSVLDGSIDWMGAGHNPRPQSTRLWIFPPQLAHGWTAIPGQQAEVAVFHFTSVPEGFASLLPENEPLSVPLKAADKTQIRALAQEAKQHLAHPKQESGVIFHAILGTLCRLALREVPSVAMRSSDEIARQRCEAAMRWYEEHCYLAPNVADMAHAVHTSTAQLRRNFHRIHQASPQQMVRTIQMRKAVELLRDPNNSVAMVSHECGFTSQSIFSRVFRKEFGRAPSAWRTGVLRTE